MHNPLQPTPENLARGKDQFNTYCAPCYGESAEANGPVTHILEKRPTNLILGASKVLPDGYIYGDIRDGVLNMPSYAEEMPAEQRWQVVMYVRSIQNAAAAKDKVAGQPRLLRRRQVAQASPRGAGDVRAICVRRRRFDCFSGGRMRTHMAGLHGRVAPTRSSCSANKRVGMYWFCGWWLRGS
jgi:Cytochrome C oxidase, cbb3-type, subunit III